MRCAELSSHADSTDDALSQFYTENLMSRLTSDVSTEVPNALPGSQKAIKDPAAIKNLRKTPTIVLRLSFFHEAEMAVPWSWPVKSGRYLHPLGYSTRVLDELIG
jgi:hypothetical protein